MRQLITLVYSIEYVPCLKLCGKHFTFVVLNEIVVSHKVDVISLSLQKSWKLRFRNTK